jgi:hypothetical protein
MGVDKNSSPRRELGLCPKFTTKDPHTSLPKSRSHNGPTNLRSKPQTIPKRKRNSRKELSRSALDQADRPQAPGGPSVRSRWTVRRHWADRPERLGGLSAWLRRTVRKIPPNLQYCTSIADCPRWVCGPSAPSRTVRHSSTDRSRTPCNKNPQIKWIERKTCKNSQRTRRTLGLSWSSWIDHHVLADCPPGGIPTARARPLEGQLHLPFARSLESTKGLLPNHR